MADGTTFNADDLDQNEVIVLGERTGTLSINGKRNRVVIGEGARLNDCDITVEGDDNIIEIGPWSLLNRTQIHFKTSDAALVIGQTAGIANACFNLYEPSRIDIGDFVGIACDVWMATSDLHPIYDANTGRRINPARDIKIGDRVGFGLRAIVLRGTRIGDKSLIGAGSVVRGRIPAGALVSGNPARVLRKNIRWEWDFPQTSSAPSNSGKAATA